RDLSTLPTRRSSDMGAGPIALLTVIAAKAEGASKIFVFDLSEERLNKAKAIGATHTINSGESNPSDVINKHTDNGVDVAFEVAGVAPTHKSDINVTRARDNVCIVSIFVLHIYLSTMTFII